MDSLKKQIRVETSEHHEDGVTLIDNDIASFNMSIDCFLMGSKTYELALSLGWPYGDKPVLLILM